MYLQHCSPWKNNDNYRYLDLFCFFNNLMPNKNLRKKLLRKIDDLADKYDYDDPKVGDIDDDDDD